MKNQWRLPVLIEFPDPPFCMAQGMAMGDINFSRMHKPELILILSEAVRVSTTNANFAFASLFSSLPLLLFSVLYFDVLLERALLQALHILGLRPEPVVFPDSNLPFPVYLMTNITSNCCTSLIRLGLFWLVKLHVLELYPLMVIVQTSSELYASRNSSTVWESIRVPRFPTKLRRLLVTALYATFFSACFLVGSIWLIAVYTLIVKKSSVNNFFGYIATALYRAGCVGLPWKWLEISAVMNMSMVVSILEEAYGAEALALSVHLSSRRKGRTNIPLNAMFFVLDTSSRLVCFGARHRDRPVPGVIRFGFLHFVNVMRWVSFTVSFCRSEDRVKISADDEEESIT